MEVLESGKVKSHSKLDESLKTEIRVLKDEITSLTGSQGVAFQNEIDLKAKLRKEEKTISTWTLNEYWFMRLQTNGILNATNTTLNLIPTLSTLLLSFWVKRMMLLDIQNA